MKFRDLTIEFFNSATKISVLEGVFVSQRFSMFALFRRISVLGVSGIWRNRLPVYFQECHIHSVAV